METDSFIAESLEMKVLWISGATRPKLGEENKLQRHHFSVEKLLDQVAALSAPQKHHFLQQSQR